MNTQNSNTVSHPFGDKRYYSLNDYCKQTFGEKVYRLSLQGGMTCPNRDGTLSRLGCSFCSKGGSGDFAAPASFSISEQLNTAKERIRNKTDCRKFIAYFQSYTNTYAPVSYLRSIFSEAVSHPDVAVLSIGTRSDCLPEEVLELLSELNTIKPVWIELGLQSIHNSTLQRLNTHTTAEQFDRAFTALSQRQIPVVAHLILGLPGETKEMMMESVLHLAKLNVWGVKLQLLHILQHTALAEEYAQHPFPLFTCEEYCDFVVDCVEQLPPDMVIHRLTGDGPKKILVAPEWSGNKKLALNTLSRRFRERDTWQGRLYHQ